MSRFAGRIGHIYVVRRRIGHIYILGEHCGVKGKAEDKGEEQR